MSEGYSLDAAADAKKLERYAKMKAKLSRLGCWTGNGAISIQLAYQRGEIDDEQKMRYETINRGSNSARHSLDPKYASRNQGNVDRNAVRTGRSNRGNGKKKK